MIAPHFLKRFSIFFLGLVLAFLFSGLASFVLYLCSINTNNQHIWAIAAIALYIIFIFTIIWIWRTRLREDKSTPNVWNNILWLFVATVVMLTMYWGLNELSNDYQSSQNTYNTFTLVYTFVFYVCFAPIVEETICRGWFLSLFFKPSNDVAINIVLVVVSCLVSAYISTMMHGFTDLKTLIPIFINGCIAAILYLKSNTITVPIIFHTIINAIAWISMF